MKLDVSEIKQSVKEVLKEPLTKPRYIPQAATKDEPLEGKTGIGADSALFSRLSPRSLRSRYRHDKENSERNGPKDEKKSKPSPPNADSYNWKVYDAKKLAEIPPFVLEAMTCTRDENCNHDHSQYRLIGNRIYVSSCSSHTVEPNTNKMTAKKPVECCLLEDEHTKHNPITEGKEGVLFRQAPRNLVFKEMREISTQMSNPNLGEEIKGQGNDSDGRRNEQKLSSVVKCQRATRCIISTQEMTLSGADFRTRTPPCLLNSDRTDKNINTSVSSPARPTTREQDMPPPPSGYHVRHDFSTSETTATEILLVKQSREDEKQNRKELVDADHRKVTSKSRSEGRHSNKLVLGGYESRGAHKSVHSRGHIMTSKNIKKELDKKSRAKKLRIIGKLNCMPADSKTSEEGSHRSHKTLADLETYEAKHNSNIEGHDSRSKAHIALNWRSKKHGHADIDDFKESRRSLGEYAPRAIRPSKNSPYLPMSKDAVLYYYKPVVTKSKSSKPSKHNHSLSNKRRRRHERPKSGAFSINDYNYNHNATVSRNTTPRFRVGKVICKSNALAFIEKVLPMYQLNTNSNASGPLEANCDIENNVSLTKSPQENVTCTDPKENVCRWVRSSGSDCSVSFNDVEYVTRNSVPSDFHNTVDGHEQHDTLPIFRKDLDPNLRYTSLGKNDSFEDLGACNEKNDSTIEGNACKEEMKSIDEPDMAVPETVNNRKWTKTAETFFFKFETVARKNTRKTVYSALPGHGQDQTLDLKSISDSYHPDKQNLETVNTFEKQANTKPTIAPPAPRHSRIVKRGRGTFDVEEITKPNEAKYDANKEMEPRGVLKLREQFNRNRPQMNPRLSRSHSPFVMKHLVKKTSSDRSAGPTKSHHKKSNDTPSLAEANIYSPDNLHDITTAVSILSKSETETIYDPENTTHTEDTVIMPFIPINTTTGSYEDEEKPAEDVQKSQEDAESFFEDKSAPESEYSMITCREVSTLSQKDKTDEGGIAKTEDGQEEEHVKQEEVEHRIEEETNLVEDNKEGKSTPCSEATFSVPTIIVDDRQNALGTDIEVSNDPTEEKQNSADINVIEEKGDITQEKDTTENEDECVNYTEEYIEEADKSKECLSALMSRKDIFVKFEKEKDTISVLYEVDTEKESKSKSVKKAAIANNSAASTKKEPEDPNTKPPIDKQTLLMNYRKKMKRLKLCKAPKNSEDERISGKNTKGHLCQNNERSGTFHLGGCDQDDEEVGFARTEDDISSIDDEGVTLRRVKKTKEQKMSKMDTQTISEDAEKNGFEIDTEDDTKSSRHHSSTENGRKTRKEKKRKKPHRCASTDADDRASSLPRSHIRPGSPESNHSRPSSILQDHEPESGPKCEFDNGLERDRLAETTSKKQCISAGKAYSDARVETPTSNRMKKIFKVSSPTSSRKEFNGTDTADTAEALSEQMLRSPPVRAARKKAEAELGWNRSPVTTERASKPKLKKKMKYRLVKAAPRQAEVVDTEKQDPPELTPWQESSGGMSECCAYGGYSAGGACGGLDGKSEHSALHLVESEKKHTDGRTVQFSDSIETYVTSPTDIEIYDEDLEFAETSPRRSEGETFTIDEDCMETPICQLTPTENFCSDAEETAAEQVETPLQMSPVVSVQHTSLETLEHAPLDKPPKKKIPVWIRDKQKQMSSPKLDARNKTPGKHKLQARSSLPLLKKKKRSKDENSVSYNKQVSRSFQPNPLDDKAKMAISTVGSPVDIKEIIEGSSVDKSLKKGKKHSPAVHETKSAPSVNTKRSATLTSKTSMNTSLGKRPEIILERPLLNKALACKKTVAQCSPRVFMGRDSSPRLQQQLSPPDSVSVRSTDLDSVPRQSVKFPKQPAIPPKNVPHWNRPTPQWIRPVRRDRKLTRKSTAPGCAAGSDMSGGVRDAADRSNTPGPHASASGSLSGNLSRMVHGMFSKLSSFDPRRRSNNQESLSDTQAEPVASMII